MSDELKNVRNVYKQVLEEVLGEVQENHTLLDSSADMVGSNGGTHTVGLGRKTWPSRWPAWPSGIWLGSLRLAHLTSEDEDAPYAAKWPKPPDKVDLQMSGWKQRLEQAATKVLSNEERRHFVFDDGDESVWYPLPQSRQELLEELMKDQSRGFIECMVGHFETMAKFIPVIDEIFEGVARGTKAE